MTYEILKAVGSGLESPNTEFGNYNVDCEDSSCDLDNELNNNPMFDVC